MPPKWVFRDSHPSAREALPKPMSNKVDGKLQRKRAAEWNSMGCRPTNIHLTDFSGVGVAKFVRVFKKTADYADATNQ